MPNDYGIARKARDPENKSRIVVETPGVKDESSKPRITMGPLKREPATRELSPDELRSEEIKNRGGAYSDRIKIEPKFNAPPREKPLPSDTEIQKGITSQQTKI
jgi:hypothetical protein